MNAAFPRPCSATAMLAALLTASAAAPALAAADLRFAKPHIVLLWEDAGGFSDDVAGLDGPVAAVTDKGRSVQMVVDLMVEGEANASFEPAPILHVEVRGADGRRLVDARWTIGSIGDFGTAMRSFIVDHDCAPVEMEARIEEAGQVTDRWSRRMDFVCD